MGFASNEEEAANKAKAKATAEAERGSGEGGYMGEVVIDGVEGHYEEAGWVDEEDDEEEEGGEGRPE